MKGFDARLPICAPFLASFSGTPSHIPVPHSNLSAKFKFIWGALGEVGGSLSGKFLAEALPFLHVLQQALLMAISSHLHEVLALLEGKSFVHINPVLMNFISNLHDRAFKTISSLIITNILIMMDNRLEFHHNRR